MKKKSRREKVTNNPFRMYGSYIGLAIGLVASFFAYAAVRALCEFGPCRPTAMLIPFIPVVVGFLFGWLFHWSLRKLV
jgi:hypothetical protein